MSILIEKSPSEDIDALSRTLASLSDAGPEMALGDVSFEISEPLPVHTLGAADAASGAVDKAPHTGWRYLIDEGDQISLAEMDVGQSGGGSTFNSTARGPIADSLYRCLGSLQEFDSLSEPLNLRILDVPSLYISAIWLAGATRSWYLPYLDEGVVGAGAVSSAEEFVAHLKDVAGRSGRMPEGAN